MITLFIVVSCCPYFRETSALNSDHSVVVVVTNSPLALGLVGASDVPWEPKV